MEKATCAHKLQDAHTTRSSRRKHAHKRKDACKHSSARNMERQANRNLMKSSYIQVKMCTNQKCYTCKIDVTRINVRYTHNSTVVQPRWFYLLSISSHKERYLCKSIRMQFIIYEKMNCIIFLHMKRGMHAFTMVKIYLLEP